MDGDFFVFFLNLLFLLPILLAVRIAWPSATVFRSACALAGLYLLYSHAPRFVPIFIAYWLVVWALQRLALHAEALASPLGEKLALTVIIGVPLAPMLIWKIAPDIAIPWINDVSASLLWSTVPQVGFVDALVTLVVPLGLSFATFRALDLLLKVYLGLIRPLSLDRVMYFGLFPPILALGPISEYEEVRMDRPLPRLPLAGDIAVGVLRIMIGIIKIFAVGMPLERAAAALWQGGQAAVPATWAAVILYGLFFYVNFSGYSEVAIGASRTLGLRLKENFANPFLKTNPQAFWNAWHMSLTRWALRYIFVPFGGMRPNRQYVATFAVIITIALWHGIDLTLVIFGIYHGTIVVVHRFLVDRRRRMKRPPIKDTWYIHFAKSALVIFYVSLSIPLLILDTDQAMALYGKLFFGIPI